MSNKDITPLLQELGNIKRNLLVMHQTHFMMRVQCPVTQ